MVRSFKSLTSIIILFFFLSANATSLETSNDECDQWYKQTIKEAEKFTSPTESFQYLLKRLGNACSVIPENLQQAARTASQAPSNSEFGQLIPLLESAKPYFPEHCYPNSPDAIANSLDAECLGDDNGSSILYYMDASSYLYANAIDIELKKAGLNKKYQRLVVYLYYYSAKQRSEKLEQNK